MLTSCCQLQFSKKGDFIYFTAGDHAKVKTYVLPIPPAPEKSTTDPHLPAKYTTPVVITSTGAASGLQTLPYGRAIISRSSYTSPNDVYLISGLNSVETEILQSDEPITFKGDVRQVTRFTEDSLHGKKLSVGEEFWFKGAEDKDVQGWVLKPRGWTEGDKKKWPVVLLIHGG